MKRAPYRMFISEWGKIYYLGSAGTLSAARAQLKLFFHWVILKEQQPIAEHWMPFWEKNYQDWKESGRPCWDYRRSDPYERSMRIQRLAESLALSHEYAEDSPRILRTLPPKKELTLGRWKCLQGMMRRFFRQLETELKLISDDPDNLAAWEEAIRTKMAWDNWEGLLFELQVDLFFGSDRWNSWRYTQIRKCWERIEDLVLQEKGWS